MKKIIYLFFLLNSIIIFSQNEEKTIIIKDIDTELPIEDATVFITKSKQTLLSNAEGTVNFILNGLSNIEISHPSYNPMKLRSNLLKDKKNVFFLKSSITGLDEIIVTKQHPQKILKSIIDNSKQKLTIPGRLKVYSREFYKKNGTNSYYNDGLLNFQLYGKEKNIKADILIEQNRSYGLVDEDFSPDLLGYNLNDIIQNYYNFKYLEPLLDPNARKKYDFLIKSNSKNEDYLIMSITPVDPSKILRDDFTIVYDRKKKLILEASSFVSPSIIAGVKEKTSIGSKNIYKSSFKTMFRIDNSNYYLVGSKEEVGFERIDKKNVKTDIEVKNYFVITHFSTHKFTYDHTDVFKDKTLYNKKNSILTNYWDVSGLVATEEEEAIIASLEFRP